MFYNNNMNFYPSLDNCFLISYKFIFLESQILLHVSNFILLWLVQRKKNTKKIDLNKAYFLL